MNENDKWNKRLRNAQKARDVECFFLQLAQLMKKIITLVLIMDTSLST